jgi:CelD/BcsL family acetyltransferase involved in cellulose biosynthesis
LEECGEIRLDVVTGREARVAIATARAFRIGRFPGDPLQIDPSAAFYADVAASSSGFSRTFCLVSGGCVAAVMFGLIHKKRFHYIILACDYVGYAKYSPGLLIMDRAIQAWAAEGGEIFDFTIGDEPFKSKFGCKRTPMYSITSR